MIDEAFEALKTYDWGVEPKVLNPINEAIVATHGDADARKELETRLAFQEHSIGELSDALADARMESARNSETLLRVTAELKQLRTLLYADPGSEPPPPHY